MSDLSAETLAWLNAEAGNDRYIAHLAAHAAECVRFVAAIDRGEVSLACRQLDGQDKPIGASVTMADGQWHFAPDVLTAYRRATAPTLPEDRV